MEKTNVAVVIPTLNEERFISQCLESVLAQSYPTEKLDIMVVDGGSTDKTESIVLKYADRYKNIRFIKNPQRIQSAAFNIGVKSSFAPIIIRLDAHATYDNDYIATCVSTLAEHPECGNTGGVWEIKPQNNSLQAEANAILNKVRFGIGGATFRVGAQAGYVDTVPFGAFLRTVTDTIGGMREDLPRGEDNEYNSRIRKHGYRIYFNPDIKSSYYARDSIKSSCKQMYNNGYSIGRLLHIDRQAVGFRHLVPTAFVLSLLLSIVASLFAHSFWIVFSSILSIYFIASIGAAIEACRKYGFRFLGILPILFFCVHISYGWGTIIGILNNKYK